MPRVAACFDGEETPSETLARLGIRQSMVPQETGKALAYDQDRIGFGEEIVRRGDYLGVRPPDRPGTRASGRLPTPSSPGSTTPPAREPCP